VEVRDSGLDLLEAGGDEGQMVIFQGVLCSIVVQRDGSAKFSGNLVMSLLLYICICEL
jgi:hypothetical protein